MQLQARSPGAKKGGATADLGAKPLVGSQHDWRFSCGARLPDSPHAAHRPILRSWRRFIEQFRQPILGFCARRERQGTGLDLLLAAQSDWESKMNPPRKTGRVNRRPPFPFHEGG